MVSSIFVQDEKRDGSMIGSGTFEAVCAVVATTAGFEGTGWLLISSHDDINSGGCNHLRDISRGSRPRVHGRLDCSIWKYVSIVLFWLMPQLL